MYAIIKDNQLIWFTDVEITQENMLFDELIEWDFDTNKNYKYEEWVIVDITPLPIIPIEPTKEEQLQEVEKNLLELSWKITGLKQLIENWLNTDDDLVLIDELWVQARELAEQRKILKSNNIIIE